MSTSLPQQSTKLPRSVALLNNSFVRIVIATLMLSLSVAIPFILIQHTFDKSVRQVWPQLLCVGLSIAAYLFYVRKIEKRKASELSSKGAVREYCIGMAIGTAILLMVIGVMWISGVFHILGVNSWTVLIAPFAEFLLVACFEEILFRGIIFRIVEKSLGTSKSLLISAALFPLAHMPNAGFSWLAFAVTAAAGLMFCAAYMQTRRLWLPIGIHFAWNFMSDAVFSLTTSGNQAKGLLQAQLTGPTWLSGGTYGIEASLLSLLVIATLTIYLLRRASIVNPSISTQATS